MSPNCVYLIFNNRYYIENTITLFILDIIDLLKMPIRYYSLTNNNF